MIKVRITLTKHYPKEVLETIVRLMMTNPEEMLRHVSEDYDFASVEVDARDEKHIVHMRWWK